MYINELNIQDFCTKFQEGIKNGYVISKESDKYPQIIGQHIITTLVKEEVITVEAAKEPVKPAKKAKE